MAQIVYYFWAALKLGAPERPVAFTVPTGNFGNVYAGYAARQMGLPVSHFVIASNTNDILPRFFETGAMTMSESCRPTARAWISRSRATSSACCSTSTAATARRWPTP
jgi:threonine synthase